MTNLVPPHGDTDLKPLLVPENLRIQELERTGGMVKVPMTSREVCDLLLLSMGAYTPLDGFMGEKDWRGVCEEMRLANGLFWPIPVTVSAEQSLADQIELGDNVALVDGETGQIMGILAVEDKYLPDLSLECEKVLVRSMKAIPASPRS
jgi:sulfate adenylyltransferase